MSKFRVIEFQLLQACNASCVYCAYDQNLPEFNTWLPLEMVEKTLKEEKPEWVWFEGGEVTMSEKSKNYLLQAMEIANRYGVKNRINTNCKNIDPQWAQRLADGGLQFACVSFDTLDADRFEFMRGFSEGSGAENLERLKANALSLADRGITVDLEATVTRHNLHELEALYDYAESVATPGRNIIMGAQCLVATYDSVFELYPNIDEMYEVFIRLTEKARNGKIPVRICCSPMVSCKYPELYKPHPNIIWVGCSCGFDYVHIHATGDVHLCGFWDHTKPIGNMKDTSLREIWERSELRQQALTDIPKNCDGCQHWDGLERCHNTCFSIAHRKTGSFKTLAHDLTIKAIADAANGRES
ncbi:MAG TPA: radical SAM protein [Chlorobaculum parvum]|uniref:Radical SAM protein n=1 Tax=Chlorobaculum parvum TaxID=274539 RepID=A0A7C5HEB9_9CHLB|nr:radical SAM protein [Chlorobaculum parvum]